MTDSPHQNPTEENRPSVEPIEQSTAPVEKPTAEKSKTRPVIHYIIIMFSAALLLLLLSFFMQQRNHEELLKGLSSSNAQVQAVLDLEREKDRLEESLQETEATLAALSEQLDDVETNMTLQQSQTAAAME